MRPSRSRGAKVGKGSSVRPITNRALETLMAILADDLVEARFLDLFAGTGRVGLGALKSGATRAVFVEADGRVARQLRTALGDLSKSTESEAHLLVGSIPNVLSRLEGSFELVWADPPYDWTPCSGFERQIRRLTTPGGLFIVEHHHKTSYQQFEEPWSLERQVKHGETRLSFYRAPLTATC